jgi:RNA polymerase sigma factor (sigma-70 family)
MEVSTLRYSAGVGLHGRSPLLRLQSDERLIALLRRGNNAAFEVLVSRYHSRLLAFCRHLLGSKEDAEDVLQEVMAAAFNAILADERPINVRPWLYRIARNRSLNQLRRIQAIGVDSMDIHYSEHGASTADKVHDREQFRLLVGDIQCLPETQRTALVLREMDALSYEQIAEAMDTTVPGVKSLLVRARISLAEAAEARQLSCDEVRIELGEVAEGLRKRPSALVRRHLRGCRRCASFQSQLKQTNRALAALLPIGPMALVKQLLVTHIGHSAGTGSGATAAGAAGATGATGATAGAGGVAAGQMAAVAGGASSFGSVGGLISAGAGAVATKAAAGLAAAALVTAGAVEATHTNHRRSTATTAGLIDPSPSTGADVPVAAPVIHAKLVTIIAHHHAKAKKSAKVTAKTTPTVAKTSTNSSATKLSTKDKNANTHAKTTSGRTDTQTDSTVLSSPAQPSSPSASNSATDTSTSSGSTTTTTSSPASGGTTPTGTTGPTGDPAQPTGDIIPPPPPAGDPGSGDSSVPGSTATTADPSPTDPSAPPPSS